MSFNIVKVFQEMGVFALGIVVALTIMALASMAVFVERLWVYWRSRVWSRRFAHKAGAIMERGELDKLIAEAETCKASHLATLLGAGMKTYLAARRSPGDLPPLELTRREMIRATEEVSGDVRHGMGVLASVGSISPFVGLLGTVVGIIAAFEGIAREGSGGLGAVSAGIAEALVVTAIGLCVAIPSVLAFNYLNARADKLLVALERSRGEFLDHLENKGARAVIDADPQQETDISAAA